MSSSARFSGGRTPGNRSFGIAFGARAASGTTALLMSVMMLRAGASGTASASFRMREHEARFSRHRWYRDHRPRALSIKWSEG
jgi:hypothetical protein